VTPLGGARLLVDGRPLLAFCSNDYLGLAQDPRLAAAVHRAVDALGVGAGASPMVSGFAAAADALERELAESVGLPRALYFYAGFSANAGIIPALVGSGDAVFSDALNHACLIDGARLSRAEVQVYRHADLGDLEERLRAATARRRLVVTDAVFSMDGDLADLPRLVALCERHDALLLLDDAHGFGVLGPDGRGALAAAGLASPRVLYMATLGKALGVAGAFVAGPEVLIEWLLQKTRSYTFATAAPPLLAEALRVALAIVLGPDGGERRALLHARIAQLKDGLATTASAGWRLAPSSTAIQPLLIGDNAAALRLTEALMARGIWVPAIRPPTVPEGTARLRIGRTAGG
jgi:8-amino-7-oxononanoate synthase